MVHESGEWFDVPRDCWLIGSSGYELGEFVFHDTGGRFVVPPVRRVVSHPAKEVGGLRFRKRMLWLEVSKLMGVFYVLWKWLAA